MRRLGKNFLFGLLVTSPLVYLASCSYLSHSRRAAFETIAEGDTRETVIRKLGSTYRVERYGGEPFLRYASKTCTVPCVERWWIENRMAFDTEAWSIEFGADGRVLRKVEWSSP